MQEFLVDEYILDCSLFVLDTSFSVLTASLTDKDNTLEEKIQNSENITICPSPDNISDLYIYHNNNYGFEFDSLAITLKNTTVGFIVFPEINLTCLSSSNLDFLIFLKKIISQEFQKNPLYHNKKDNYVSYLLSDLLNEKFPDEELIKKRLLTIDFVPMHHMNVAVIRRRLSENIGCSLELVCLQLKQSTSSFLYSITEDSLVLLFNFENGKKIEENIIEKINNICSTNDLIAGISGDFTNLVKLRQSYTNATTAALVCQRYVEDHRVIFYDDIFDLALLEYCSRNVNLMDFVHSSIINLMEYDQKYGTEYLYTFWIYTECACNCNAAAAKLYMHKNTLSYRLTKIKQIINSDLSDGKDIFAFQLSLRILRILGKLKK